MSDVDNQVVFISQYYILNILKVNKKVMIIEKSYTPGLYIAKCTVQGKRFMEVADSHFEAIKKVLKSISWVLNIA